MVKISEIVCNNFILKSIIQDMYLHKVCKSTLSFFDDQRNYMNNTKSLP